MRERVKVYELFKDLDGSSQHILFGTMNDIREWAKNLWKDANDFVRIHDYHIEEDYYTELDNDNCLLIVLENMFYDVRELCEVPLEDFYDENKAPQELVDEVIAQIKMDVELGDVTGLDELLKGIGIKELTAYLPEK